MKNNLFSILTITSILAMLFAVAAAPGAVPNSPQQAKGYATLMVMRFIYHKGYVFAFSLSGPLKQEDLVGYVDISGQRFDLHCTLKVATVAKTSNRAVCTASFPPRFVGRSAFVVLITSGTHVVIPPRNTNSCTSVYTWNQTLDDWEDFASYCTDAQLKVGDSIRMYTKNWGHTFTYVYQRSAPCEDNAGRGFYFGVTYGHYYSILCPPN
jgi:hypothetical protein